MKLQKSRIVLAAALLSCMLCMFFLARRQSVDLIAFICLGISITSMCIALILAAEMRGEKKNKPENLTDDVPSVEVEGK